MTHFELKYTCHKCADQKSLIISVPMMRWQKVHILATGLPMHVAAIVKEFFRQKSVPVVIEAEYTTGIEKAKNNYGYYNPVLIGLDENPKNSFEAVRALRKWEKITRRNTRQPIFIVGILRKLEKSIYQQCEEVGINHVVEIGPPAKMLSEVIKSFIKSRLTTKQRKALTLYDSRYRHEEAAEMLNVSRSTYVYHLNAIQEKFGISTRKELLLLEAALREE